MKFAEREARRGDHFHPDFPAAPGDPDDAEPMSMDYFVWAIVGDDRVWVVDTGFGTDDAVGRGRRLLRTAADGLALIGVDAASVTDVIITHLHYDHAGGLDQFPAARFHVQDREVAFVTGRTMLLESQQRGFTPQHIADFVLAVHAGRVVFHDGDTELAPGITVHRIGGHTDGLQVVRVNTADGWMVLAGDATHYYENLETRRPFHIVYDVAAMFDGFDRIRALAPGGGRYVPGHDPEVLRRHPAAAAGLDGIVARLDGGRP